MIEKTRIAPKPAPEEIPNNPGSARLFLSKDCKIKPEPESASPTIMAFNVRGNLKSKIIFFKVSLSEENIFIKSKKLIETDPINNDPKIVINRIPENNISINIFLFTNLLI